MNIIPLDLLVVLNLVLSLYMLGLIWIIQLIRYPQFLNIPPQDFPRFHMRHSAALGALAGLPMILELALSFLLLNRVSIFLGIALLTTTLLLWFVTFSKSVPLHNRLSSGFDEKAILELIKINWIRTWAWTVKAFIALAIYVFARS